MKIVDITDKFKDMIESFECDFLVAKDNPDKYSLNNLQKLIESEDKKILKDIDLLQELSFMLRHGQAQIITFEDIGEEEQDE